MKNSWISVNDEKVPPIESEGNGVRVSEDILVTDGENVGIGYSVSYSSMKEYSPSNTEYFCESIGKITHWQKIELPCPGSKI
jgi:hypothetical protein